MGTLGSSSVRFLSFKYHKNSSYKSIAMLQRFIITKPGGNLFEAFYLKILMEQKLVKRNFTSASSNDYIQLKENNRTFSMWSNKYIRTKLLFPSNVLSSLRFITYNKTSNIPHNNIPIMKFNSSAITNIDSSDSNEKPNIFQKLYRKVIPEKMSVAKSTLNKSGATLSACCTHEVDLEAFFNVFDMPDTYYSWWLITELHAWMLCVRLSVGNTKEGLYCRNCLVTTLYTDMDERAKKVADMDRSSRLNVVWDLAEEFKFAMLIYDLGLAGKEDPDVEKIELLVKYVRKTVASLDQIKIDDLYTMEPGSALSWPDIKKLEIERAT